MKISDTVRGDLSVWISGLFFASAAILVRFLSFSHHPVFISLIRFVVGLLLGIFSLLITRRSFKLYNKSDLFWRSFFGVISMILYYASMGISGSSRGTLLNTLYPLFVVLFGALFFSIPFKKRDFLSLLFAVPGLFVIFWENGTPGLGDILGLCSGITGGMSVHFIKRAREKNSAEMIYMSVCLFGLVPGLFTIGEFRTLTLLDAALLASVGVLVYFAQVITTYGMKFISASRSSLLSFSKVPMTFLFAVVILGEPLSPQFYLGTALLAVAILLAEDFSFRKQIPQSKSGS